MVALFASGWLQHGARLQEFSPEMHLLIVQSCEAASDLHCIML
jgi:hypothetical protein